MILALAAGTANAQSKRKTSNNTASNLPIALWVNFNGGEDIRSMAHDDKNVYLSLAYAKRMIVIDKTTGKISEVRADREIKSVAVADNKCYYYVDGMGLFRYDAATAQSEGPLFGLEGSYWEFEEIEVSPDGNFLRYGEFVVDLRIGEIVGRPGGGRRTAVNNLGGAYSSTPEPHYCPLGGEDFEISSKAVVHDIFPDGVTGNTFWCCEQGVGYTPMVPEAGAGIKRVSIPGLEDKNYIPHYITRDDEGNFVITTNIGIIFGGKTLEDTAKLVDRLKTGVKNQYGSELSLDYFGGLVQPDGNGNIIFGSEGYACICIYNPKGLKGYSEIRGKAVKF